MLKWPWEDELADLGGLQALEPMLLTAEKALMGDGQRRGPPFSLR